ncbi:uncharacterized protein BO97DRAFT_415367 [Aspergillus homomorphus CBS 101889]|uniref:Uncharacterized protein n=1 Tax=Aspergillus homomorphus (strain CBS 101889) TaxID=1450537 RepID=A0A395HUT8_ASPHC|nr:hypothetical protein BO97DRAFT_415367 [Aspergillus homomorphus CBS 101889]RAL11183.1 hypothetical protein BO97DRAFT_415367 [Aspergillus homomorphus CBS 101889]
MSSAHESPQSNPPPHPIEPPILESEQDKTYYERTRLARRQYEHATLREGLQRGLSLWTILAVLSSDQGDSDSRGSTRRLYPRMNNHYIPRYNHTITTTHHSNSNKYSLPHAESHDYSPAYYSSHSDRRSAQHRAAIHCATPQSSSASPASSTSTSTSTSPPPTTLIPNNNHHQYPTHPPNNPKTQHEYHHYHPLITFLTINPPAPDSSYYDRVSDYRVRSQKRPWEGDRSWDETFLCRSYKRRRGGGGSGILQEAAQASDQKPSVVLERGMVWEMRGDGDHGRGVEGGGGRWRYWVPG